MGGAGSNDQDDRLGVTPLADLVSHLRPGRKVNILAAHWFQAVVADGR
jgi:hypothetical protein